MMAWLDKRTLGLLVKRVPVLLIIYRLYWRVRTARDMSKRYGEPPLRLLSVDDPEPTLRNLTSQLCTASQCRESSYQRWCEEMKSPPRLGRKQWEFVYILEALFQNKMLQHDRRGLGFGCGREPLPAVMARHGCQVVATDLAPDEAAGKGWIETHQHASSLEMLNTYGICEPDAFRSRVSFRFADMNHVPADLRDFDFVWSSCAFEHLGSIRHGLDFVKNTMACLKPGGIAVHTTEFNLSSNDKTLEDPNCVLFRQRDMLQLSAELETNGYKIEPFNFNSGEQPVDKHIDAPPFSPSPHLKLKLGEYAATSIGLVVRKPVAWPHHQDIS